MCLALDVQVKHVTRHDIESNFYVYFPNIEVQLQVYELMYSYSY